MLYFDLANQALSFSFPRDTQRQVDEGELLLRDDPGVTRLLSHRSQSLAHNIPLIYQGVSPLLGVEFRDEYPLVDGVRHQVRRHYSNDQIRQPPLRPEQVERNKCEHRHRD